MRYILLFVLFIASFSQAQQQSAYNRVLWNELSGLSKHYQTTGEVNQHTIDRFPVYKINGKWYVSLYGKRLAQPDWSIVEDNGIMIGSSVGEVTTMKVPLNRLHQIDFSTFYAYLEIPGKIVPNLDRAVKDTRADSVQRGINLPAAFTGKDVMIGITDWGFDYGHPMFYDTLLTTSRIAAAWDQYKQAGTPPSGFSYGAEYDTPTEIATAETDTANIYSHHTHGNHVAGIAGGSGAGSVYRGFAFESEYLFATFYIDEASVIDAFVWMRDKASAAGKRLVISMSWGVYYNAIGTVDGNSLLSQTISQMSDENNIVFVGAAGNNGSVNFHIKKEFNNDAFNSQVAFYDYSANAAMWGQCVTMWGEENHNFSAKISIYNSANSLLVSSPFYATDLTTNYVDSILVTGNDTIYFNVSAEPVHPLNDRPRMQIRVKNTHTNLKIVLTGSAVDGTVHYWNVAELTNGAGNFGQPFVYVPQMGLNGDANYGIGEPACAEDVITVAAYASGYLNTQGNPAGGTLASFSSAGPLYNEEMKPDISAPGVNVISSISSYTDASYASVATITFNGQDYDFARFSGTSMATPCISGIVALILDANPTLSPAQVKEILKTTARQDSFTGVITAPGDYHWGMGKVNAYQAVILALNTVSLEEWKSNNWMAVYPNPAQETVHLLFPENAKIGAIQIISVDGKSVPVQADSNASIDLTTLSSGVYTVTAEVNGTVVSKRFVKE